MTDRNYKNGLNGNEKIQTEESRNLSDNNLGGSVELDSVDWGAVARCYKLLRLRSDNRKPFVQNEKLSADFERWIAMRSETLEFDIALRMLFDEIVAVPQHLTSAGDTSSSKPDIAQRRLAAMCRQGVNPPSVK